jgi:DNA-binding transcriptional ArsR family regulator
LKALSDSSKLEIISSLKISPKYNLEIAQQLGLTPATMSHHMSVLLSCGFVGVEKMDGKVYYHLVEENMISMLEELKQALL